MISAGSYAFLAAHNPSIGVIVCDLAQGKHGGFFLLDARGWSYEKRFRPKPIRIHRTTTPHNA